MRQDTKEKFVAALRSGKYRKGMHALRYKSEHPEGDCFCALGVLIDSCAPELWQSPTAGELRWAVNGARGSIPVSVMDKLGVTPHEADMLVHINDGLHFDFSQIAYMVERNLLPCGGAR